MLSPYLLLFVAIVHFLLLVTVKILGRPFLHVLVRRFEMVEGEKVAVALGKIPKAGIPVWGKEKSCREQPSLALNWCHGVPAGASHVGTMALSPESLSYLWLLVL